MGAYYGLGLGLGGAPVPIRGSHLALGGLIEQFPNAAAAYSLRGLRNNVGNVVRVRRDSDNDERDFTPSQITSGELVNWVNAETTLPLDLRELESDGRTGSVIPAAAAYSLRKLKESYTGNVVQLRRDTDDTLNAFTVSEIESGAMLNWVTELDPNAYAYVRTWFDQSGNSNHVTQTTASKQPKIVENGTYLEELKFDGTDDFLTGSHSLDTDDLLSLHTVATFEDLDTRSVLVQDLFYVNSSNNGGFTFQNKAFANNLHIAGYGDDELFRQEGRSELTEGSEELYSLQLQSGTSNFYINGSLEDSISASMNSEDGGNVIAIGANDAGSSYFFEGSVKEIILYNSDRSDDRTALESNIGSYYEISGIPAYDNTVNGFVETWYDQAGSNDAEQTTAANQPQIVEDGDLVEVENKPAIKFDGASSYLILDNELSFNSSLSSKANSIFNVASIVGGDRSYLALGTGTFNWFGVPYAGNYQYRDNSGNVINTNDAVPLNEQISFTFISDESNRIETYQNGTSIQVRSNAFTNRLRIKNIGRGYQSTQFNEMSSQEIVMFADDKTSDVSRIHDNINAHYDIYS